MGQQQLLLIVLGVIIVGIAIVVGINLFNANAVSSNRDGVLSDLQNLAAIAHQFYVKPSAMGGGENSFVGITQAWMDANESGLESNANGNYTVSTAGAGTGTASTVTFQGIGKQLGKDGKTGITMQILVRVPPLSDSLMTVN